MTMSLERRDEPATTATARRAKALRLRNLAIGLALGFLCLLFYAVTIVKLGPGVLSRPL